MTLELNTLIQELYKFGDENTINAIFSNENVQTQREQLFDFLKMKYNELTQNRKKNFMSQCDIIKEIELYKKDIIKIEKKLEGLKQSNSTYARKVERQNYNRDLFYYHIDLYKIVISGLLVCLLISIIGYSMSAYNTINLAILYLFLTSIIIGYLLIIIYIIYYLTYNIKNRNKFRFDKLDLENLAKGEEKLSCDPEKPSSAELEREKTIQDARNQLENSYNQ